MRTNVSNTFVRLKGAEERQWQETMAKNEYWLLAVEQNGKTTSNRVYQKASAEMIFTMTVTAALEKPPFAPVKITLYWYDTRQFRYVVARMRIHSSF